MSTLYISEYASGSFSGGQALSVISEPNITDQTVTISGSHAESSAFSNNTRVIRVHTDAICCIAMGATPTATTSNKRMAANQTEYFGVVPGWKISVISTT